MASATPNPNYPTVVDEAVARLFAYRESYKPRRNTSDLCRMGNAPSITGADDEKSGAAECLTATFVHRGCRWQGSSVRPSIAAGNGRRSERRARRLRAVCVRTAAGSGFRVITKSRSTWAGLHSPAWMASCGCAGRVILSGTHRGGAPSGTHYSLACAEVEWLPSCFRFGVGVVDITAHYRTHAPDRIVAGWPFFGESTDRAFRHGVHVGLSLTRDRCRPKSWCRGRKWNSPEAYQSGHGERRASWTDVKDRPAVVGNASPTCKGLKKCLKTDRARIQVI